MINVERWEGEDYVITMNGQSLGQTLSQLNAKRVSKWLETAIGEIKMTRKDYVAIADALIETKNGVKHMRAEDREKRRQVLLELLPHLAEALARDNKNFDRGEFYEYVTSHLDEV